MKKKLRIIIDIETEKPEFFAAGFFQEAIEETIDQINDNAQDMVMYGITGIQVYPVAQPVSTRSAF